MLYVHVCFIKIKALIYFFAYIWTNKYNQFLGQGHEGKLVNLVGKTTLPELAVLLKKCKVLVSGDSGPMHLAACVGIPVVALFRNDIPGKTKNRWGPWGKGHTVIERGSLLNINIDEVYTAIKKYL